MKSLIAGLMLILLATLCFYVPSTMFGLEGFDVSTVPIQFYRYYAWMMAGVLVLNIVYASYLLYWIPANKIYLKIPVSWLVIGETYTLIYHIINKIYLLNVSSRTGKIATMAIFAVCCTFFVYRAVAAYETRTIRLKPTGFFRAVIHISSILFFVLGIFVLRFGSGSEVLAAMCLAIPFSSFYIRQKTIKEVPSYFIIGAHLLFWVVLTGIMVSNGLPTFYTQWFVLIALIVILYKRDKNFIGVCECLRPY